MLLIGTRCRLQRLAGDHLEAVYEVQRRTDSRKETHKMENKIDKKLNAKLRTRHQSACHLIS